MFDNDNKRRIGFAFVSCYYYYDDKNMFSFCLVYYECSVINIMYIFELSFVVVSEVC